MEDSMPYYKETYLNRHSFFSLVENGVTYRPSPVVLDSTELTTFRSRPSRSAFSSQELADQQADPYAYFLDYVSKTNYQARLRERGLAADAVPDRGHAFELKRHTVNGALYTLDNHYMAGPTLITDVYNNAFVGPNFPNHADLLAVHAGNIYTPAPYQETGLEAFAQRAYARSAPTQVVFDAAQFLGELHEGLPKIASLSFQSLADFFRSLGSGYLNVQFGWLPFISDIKNAASALALATQTLSQQGERIHKRYSLPPTTRFGSVSETRSELEIFGGHSRGFIPSPSSGLAPTGTFSTYTPMGIDAMFTKTMSSERWFEGEFSFFLPLKFNPDSYLERLNVLMKTDLTPSVLWELAPWSWMIDWFLGIQDTIKANELAANDHLIMHYGYAMETVRYSSEVSWRKVSGTPLNWNGLPNHGRYFAGTTYKRRIRANPYGFQANPTVNLKGSQMAILGALGLTKAK
jgi:hypothetical protein